MVFNSHTPGNGEWHCPFPRWWVQMMKTAAKRCENVTEAQVEAALNREYLYYRIPPGEFLSEPQDARGLPLSFCEREAYNYRKYPQGSTATYDYDSIPEMVITNGYDDWPLIRRGPVLHA